MTLASFRDEFEVASRMAYLANGSVTPAARSVLAASRSWQDHWARDPQVAYRTYHDRKESLRRSIAGFIGADPDEVAITENAARGAALAIRLLAGRKGGHVLVDRTTYPSSRYPWLTGTDKRLRHVDDGGESGPDPLIAQIDDDTCAVSISHVDWASGVRHDVATLAAAAHARDALLIADASQAVGAVPVDVKRDGVDVAYGTFGKWLLAGPGLGFLYVRKELIEAGPVLDPGWKSLAVDGREWPGETMPEPVDGAQRFEPGLPNLNGIIMAQAGLDLIGKVGAAAIFSAIGTLAGQAIDGHDALVGHCVNTLPLLFEPDLDRPAALAIEQAQTTLLDALEHQRLTFGSLLRKLRIGRDPSRLPLVSVMFNIDQALDHEDSAFPGLQLEFASNPRRYENFELAINAVQSHGELRLECQYNRELFDGATIRQWLGHYQTLLQAMAADDDTAFGRLPLLADIEQRKVLEKFNATHVDYPAGQCIHELIEAQVARTPQAIAVSHEGATLSYAGLNERANRLAHHLRASGVRPDQRVAICAERSLELVVGLLAILKAGAAYVPLDPEYPPERLAWMLQDCAPAMLLTQQALVSRLAPLAPAVPPLALDQAAPAWAECEASNPLAAANGLHDRHLAYVIYTSGSTGLPKGAMNEHRGVVNRLRWMQEMFAVDARDVVLQKTPCSFDVSVWEFFLPLMSGARLVMARAGGHRDPAYLADTIRREQVSTIHFVPSMLHAFLDHGDTAACASLKQVICSGEALPAVLAAAFFRQLPGVGLHNLYGPTEAAVDVTAWACVAGDDASSIPIGRPVANTRIYILDGYGQPVPVGVAGEIFIGGVQVGRGYLNRETLTAERFLPDPFAHDADARMYKTGDLGRWRADGNIEYLGRNDFQVKLRGFRIELGEIEHRLATNRRWRRRWCWRARIAPATCAWLRTSPARLAPAPIRRRCPRTCARACPSTWCRRTT